MHLRSVRSLVVLCFAVLALAVLSSGPVLAKTAAAIRVQCAGDRHFLLHLDRQRVRVMFDNRQPDLRREPSSLGRKYAATGATLIIDGDSVAFVLQDDLDWRDCRIGDGAAPPP
jgi:hypothetical protein